jgi:DNA-binding NarL/FixJ family response regulator
VEATLGDEANAREHAELASRISAGQSRSRLFEAHSARVRGLLELGAGRPAEAAELLGVAGRFAVAEQIGDPVVFSWAANLTEALVRAGRPEQAVRAYRSVLREAERTCRPTAMAAAARCRGLLASSVDEGRHAFEEALAWHAKGSMPFEQARTQLCFGEFLHDHRLAGEARTQLGNALAMFTRLGAVQWARRAEDQTNGLRADRPGQSATERLTPQELQVAIVVADGVTNAEAAARLFLSAKTIEFHLSNIYRKLGIRSRAELVRLVMTGLPGVSHDVPRTSPSVSG